MAEIKITIPDIETRENPFLVSYGNRILKYYFDIEF